MSISGLVTSQTPGPGPGAASVQCLQTIPGAGSRPVLAVKVAATAAAPGPHQ